MEKRVSFDILFPAVRRLIDRLMVLALPGSVGLFVLYPMVCILLRSLSSGAGGLTLDSYVQVWSQYQTSLRNSVFTALCTSALSTLFSLSSALLVSTGRGWRRVVPSPLPRRIVEIGQVRDLWDKTIVVTCGGGGVPVVETAQGRLEGVAAVIDKDFAAELLAEQVDADVLMILTEVEKVAINWGKPDQKDLSRMSLAEASRYVEEGHFAPGSMLPKVQAAMKFVRSDPGKKAVITSLDKALDALAGKTGTVITFA